MLEWGLLVGIGLLVMLAKMPWRAKLWVVSHPVTIDVTVFIALTLIHWGTFSGVMVAAIGALFCSITLSVAKLLVGHIKAGRYFPGVFNVIGKLRS